MRETLRSAGAALGQLLVTFGLALVALMFLPLLLFTAVLTLLVVGAGVLPESVVLMRRFAGVERRRVRDWTGEVVPEAYEPLTGGLRERVRTAVGDPATPRELRWLGLYFLYGTGGWLVAMPLCVVGVVVDGVLYMAGGRPAVLPLLTRMVDRGAGLSRRLLTPAPGGRLAERVEELTVTRAGAVAAHGAELRRIERDLHDGTQARLVSLSMRIGLARRAYDADPTRGRALLDDAQDQVEAALGELRHVVRGIHPPILTDRGLVGAVRALAAASGLQVVVDVAEGADGPRAPAAVEAAAYFVVAEALTNAAKHSGAERATVELARGPGVLRIGVRDEGRGGADERGGTGLLGIRRRIAALDGTVRVSSPAGGPTVVDVEIPNP
ncbi:sensor domain-containing protein [Streptomyces sp. NBC_01511]|uniref:sensor histidine kinase n=1 Tax=unclassified Streptomyces TaxID=2593676 RepID=UPI00386DBF6A